MKYIRDSQVVLSNLFENKAGQVLTKKNCMIQVPVRFSEVGLGEIGINTYTYGCLAIILETGQYAVMNINALIELNPTKITIVKIDEIEYHQFFFEENTVVIKTTDVVKRDTIIFNVFDELIFKGKMPWYMSYEDVGKLMDTSLYHADSGVNKNLEVIEFIASLITRSVNDRSINIRHIGQKYSDFDLSKITYIPLKSIYYAVNTTVNKLAGSYFKEGVTSALVNQSDRVDKIESILRA